MSDVAKLGRYFRKLWKTPETMQPWLQPFMLE
jgi:hypothetical protein